MEKLSKISSVSRESLEENDRSIVIELDDLPCFFIPLVANTLQLCSNDRLFTMKRWIVRSFGAIVGLDDDRAKENIACVSFFTRGDEA